MTTAKRPYETGEVYGRMVLLNREAEEPPFWNCLCLCGEQFRRDERMIKELPFCVTCKEAGVPLVASKDERRMLSQKWHEWWTRRIKVEAATKRRTPEQKNADAGDLTGQRFGRLLVTGPADAGYWLCDCDCGSIGVRLAGGRLAAKRDGVKKCVSCARIINLPKKG